jgi:glycyl-tRNA synthetase beta subunit
MPIRQSIITLVTEDVKVLGEAAAKTHTEALVAAMRRALNDGTDAVTRLRNSKVVTADLVTDAERALSTRLERLRHVPEALVDSQAIADARAALNGALELCRQLAGEFEHDQSSASVLPLQQSVAPMR